MDYKLIFMFIGTTISFSGLVWGIIKYDRDKADGKQTEFQNKIERLISSIRDELHNTQIDMSKNYVMNHVYEQSQRDNSASHGIMHEKISTINDRITRLETTIDRCPSCSGKDR